MPAPLLRAHYAAFWNFRRPAPPKGILAEDKALGLLPKDGVVGDALNTFRESAMPAENWTATKLQPAEIVTWRESFDQVRGYWEMKIDELQRVAKMRGIKRDGQSWKAAVGGTGSRANIIAALTRLDEEQNAQKELATPAALATIPASPSTDSPADSGGLSKRARTQADVASMPAPVVLDLSSSSPTATSKTPLSGALDELQTELQGASWMEGAWNSLVSLTLPTEAVQSRDDVSAEMLCSLPGIAEDVEATERAVPSPSPMDAPHEPQPAMPEGMAREAAVPALSLSAVKKPSPKPKGVLGGRKLAQKSRPFWDLKQSRAAVAKEVADAVVPTQPSLASHPTLERPKPLRSRSRRPATTAARASALHALRTALTNEGAAYHSTADVAPADGTGSQGSEPLPNGWREFWDPSSGAWYYQSPGGQTSWERPSGVVPERARALSVAQAAMRRRRELAESGRLPLPPDSPNAAHAATAAADSAASSEGAAVVPAAVAVFPCLNIGSQDGLEPLTTGAGLPEALPLTERVAASERAADDSATPRDAASPAVSARGHGRARVVFAPSIASEESHADETAGDLAAPPRSARAAVATPGTGRVSSAARADCVTPSVPKLAAGTRLLVWWSADEVAYECTVVECIIRPADDDDAGAGVVFLHRCEYAQGRHPSLAPEPCAADACHSSSALAASCPPLFPLLPRHYPPLPRLFAEPCSTSPLHYAGTRTALSSKTSRSSRTSACMTPPLRSPSVRRRGSGRGSAGAPPRPPPSSGGSSASSASTARAGKRSGEPLLRGAMEAGALSVARRRRDARDARSAQRPASRFGICSPPESD